MPTLHSDLLPTLLQRPNVARYDEGTVVIADRRAYPFSLPTVRCRSVAEVARAIEQMVTQGGGQWVAALYGLVMAARTADAGPSAQRWPTLTAAAERLVATRPTNTSIRRQLEHALEAVRPALEDGESLEVAVLAHVEEVRDQHDAAVGRRADHARGLLRDGDGVLTLCFAEASFLLALALARDEGKRLSVVVPETRPYLQGARLTAPSIAELDIPVRLVPDGAPAHAMASGLVTTYMTAADLVTLDGHVVNKVGTLQAAIAARAFGVPYHALSLGPDPRHPDRSSIVIEERDPTELRTCAGQPTTRDDIDAWYPAFDVTPPDYVTGVITDRGVFAPGDIRAAYGKES